MSEPSTLYQRLVTRGPWDPQANYPIGQVYPARQLPFMTTTLHVNYPRIK